MSQPAYRQRFRLVDGPARLDEPGLSDSFDLLVEALDDPHTVEAALAVIAYGAPKLVGVDWADVTETARGAVGLARVVPRVLNVAVDLRVARDDLAARGFGFAFVFVQLPDSADWKHYTLEGLDELTEDVFASAAGPVTFTVATGWLWSSRSVLIGFGENKRD